MTPETRWALYGLASTACGLLLLAAAIALHWHDRHLEETP